MERQEYPSVTFSFEHQQFQEFFAAQHLKRNILALVDSGDRTKIHEYTGKYVNEPIWSESLRMIAEEIGASKKESADNKRTVEAGKLLVEMALSVDPIFAADLTRLCGVTVWKDVEPILSDCLRKWYKSKHSSHRRCALAGMMATGSPDFNDIILPLLTHEDRQVRLGAYQALDEFHLSTLGPDWQDVINEWEEEARIDFATELMHQKWIPEVAEYFLLKDPSIKVRAEAIQSIGWVGSASDLVPLIEKVDQESFECAIQNMSLDILKPIARERALLAFRKLCSESKDPIQRLRYLIKCDFLGEKISASLLKDEFVKIDHDQMKDLGEFIIKPALEIICRTDPQWVSHWVAERVADGSLYYDHWCTFISMVPKSIITEWFDKLASKDLKYQRPSSINQLLSVGADSALAENIFMKLCDVRRLIASTPSEKHEKEYAITRQLEDLYRSLPPAIAVSGLANTFKKDLDEAEFAVVLDLFSRVGREDADLRDELDEAHRQDLRAYLVRGLDYVLGKNDFTGSMKANLATALARVGVSGDMDILRNLIQADLERMRKGRAARARGEQTPLAAGGTTSYANWHVKAVMQLNDSVADTVFLDLLQEPEYERDAALSLVRLAAERDYDEPFGLRYDYSTVWKAREGERSSRFEEDRRKRYSVVLRERVSDLLAQHKAGTIDASYRLLELTGSLAVLDARDSAELIWEVLLLPIEWHEYARLNGLQSLLFAGVVLPTEETISVFNNTLV